MTWLSTSSTRALVWPALAIAILGAGSVCSQSSGSESQPTYGETPDDLVPFKGSGEPYLRFFTSPPEFRGPGRDAPDPEGVEQVLIGVLAPRSGDRARQGDEMRNGVTLAIEDANAAGGYAAGVPFAAVFRDENLAWGAAASVVVDAADRGVWGLVGALEDTSSHVMARVLLKVELPMINTGGSDPTLTEHAIPWLLRMRPDDRQNAYVLATRIFETDGHQKVVVFRANDRYSRMGIQELVDAARRIHHPILLEMRFENHDTDFATQISRIRSVAADAIVLWGEAAPAGRALAALRAAGLEQPVYGPDHLIDDAFLEAAGPAAEGAVLCHPFSFSAAGNAWEDFHTRYEDRFETPPGCVAAYAYEGARYLLSGIRAAGLNRPRIRDWLFAQESWQGVTGRIQFDATHNNITRGILARVSDGAFVFD